MPLAVLRRAAVIGLAILLVVPASALADTLSADGDSLTTGNQTTIALGDVVAGATLTVDVDLVLGCGSTSHLAPGTYSIGLDTVTEPDDGILTADPASLTVPADWPAPGSSCNGTGPAVSSTPARLRVTAPTVTGTAKTFDVLFASPGDAISNTTAFTLTMNVVAPTPKDTTNPVLHAMPSDIAVQTQGTNAVVTWADPTATDDTDPAPTVGCSPASGSTFALGATTVTCTATDASGNHASAIFTVTVTQAPAYTGTWGRPLGDGVPALVGRAGRTVPLKLDIRLGGQLQGPGSIAAPTLRAERLVACASDAATTTTADLGAFAWNDGSWQLNLSTGSLGAGCLRLRALEAGTTVATAVVQLVPDTTTLSPSHKR